jgi:hypothetical protein
MLTPDALNAATRAYWRSVGLALLPLIAGILLSEPIHNLLSLCLASIGYTGDPAILIFVPVILGGVA